MSGEELGLKYRDAAVALQILFFGLAGVAIAAQQDQRIVSTAMRYRRIVVRFIVLAAKRVVALGASIVLPFQQLFFLVARHCQPLGDQKRLNKAMV